MSILGPDDVPLSRAGLPPDVTAALASRFDRLLGRLAGDRDRRRGCRGWFVPGRIEFLGKHTDYAGGRSVVCGVERGLSIVARPRGDDLVSIADVGRESSIVLSASDADTPLHWAVYPLTVWRRLTANFPGPLRGADIAFESDLPSAAGLSSSSALMVAVLLALIRANDLRDDGSVAREHRRRRGSGGVRRDDRKRQRVPRPARRPRRRHRGREPGSHGDPLQPGRPADAVLVQADTARAERRPAGGAHVRSWRQRRAGAEDRGRARPLQPCRAIRRNVDGGLARVGRHRRDAGRDCRLARRCGATSRAGRRPPGTPQPARPVRRGIHDAGAGGSRSPGGRQPRRARSDRRFDRSGSPRSGWATRCPRPSSSPGWRAPAARSRPPRSAPDSAAASGRWSTPRGRQPSRRSGRMHIARRIPLPGHGRRS